MEEAGVDIVVERLAYLHQTPRTTHVNGDQVDYLDITFRCRWVAGEPHPADGELTGLVWRRLDDVASDDLRERIRLAAAERGEAVFGV